MRSIKKRLFFGIDWYLCNGTARDIKSKVTSASSTKDISDMEFRELIKKQIGIDNKNSPLVSVTL